MFDICQLEFIFPVSLTRSSLHYSAHNGCSQQILIPLLLPCRPDLPSAPYFSIITPSCTSLNPISVCLPRSHTCPLSLLSPSLYLLPFLPVLSPTSPSLFLTWPPLRSIRFPSLFLLLSPTSLILPSRSFSLPSSFPSLLAYHLLALPLPSPTTASLALPFTPLLPSTLALSSLVFLPPAPSPPPLPHRKLSLPASPSTKQCHASVPSARRPIMHHVSRGRAPLIMQVTVSRRVV